MIESSTLLKASSAIRYRIIDGEAIVVQQVDARVLNLNPLGSRILAALDGQTPVGDLVDRLAGDYDVDPAVFAADVLRYLGELEAAHVIEPVATPAGGGGDGL
ncbi:MAG: PqqD family protein [Chromatiaceae bacterium]